MPYRLDITNPDAGMLERLVELGALDVDGAEGWLAAILPDSVDPGIFPAGIISEAVARDDGSVWVLNPIPPLGLRLKDSAAFGTGHHATTAMCIEAMQEIVGHGPVERMLDVGTGTGILALAGLALGVGQAVGVDTDESAIADARENARLNGVENRARFAAGGPDALDESFALVVANILAAPLIGMAPELARRVASRGELVLAGISESLAAEVARAYRRVGFHHLDSEVRQGWVTQRYRASW